MAVHRHQWEGDFTVVPNDIFRNPNLSLRDIGLLCFALSRSPDFAFSVRGLERVLPNDGRRVIEGGVEALKNAGYASGKQESNAGFQKGSFDISDLPCVHSVCAQNVQTQNVQTQSVRQRKTDILKTDILKTDIPKREGKPSARSRFVPPTVEEVRAYCIERANGIDPEAFCDYYEAQGWKLSNGQQMRDFKAAVRNWEHRGRERAQEKQPKVWTLTDMKELDYG